VRRELAVEESGTPAQSPVREKIIEKRRRTMKLIEKENTGRRVMEV